MLMSRYRLCRRVSEVATGEATVVPAGSRAPASSELVRKLVDAWAIWWRKKQNVLVWSDGSKSAAWKASRSTPLLPAPMCRSLFPPPSPGPPTCRWPPSYIKDALLLLRTTAYDSCTLTPPPPIRSQQRRTTLGAGGVAGAAVQVFLTMGRRKQSKNGLRLKQRWNTRS